MEAVTLNLSETILRMIYVAISAVVMAGGSGSCAADGSLWVLLGSLSAFIDSVTINIVLNQRRLYYVHMYSLSHVP